MKAVSPDLKRQARTFTIGAACGFIAGAMLVGIIVSKYGNAREAGDPVSSTASSTPAPGAAASGRSVDGLADVDTPIIVSGMPPAIPASAGTAGSATPPGADSANAAPVASELASRHLEIPVEGIRPDQLTRTFDDQRSGTRQHQALDIIAPRNTPVKAVEDGTIARLFLSNAGGITIYQFDPSESYAYYYAHLERYADGLKEGDRVRKGQVLGYVGTSGNAPKDTPHLHFAVFRLTAAKRWWEGSPIDPYDILR
jgi:murein DD-endopeptidase MepM/ murein hydrolase activator NlpD